MFPLVSKNARVFFSYPKIFYSMLLRRMIFTNLFDISDCTARVSEAGACLLFVSRLFVCSLTRAKCNTTASFGACNDFSRIRAKLYCFQHRPAVLVVGISFQHSNIAL